MQAELNTTQELKRNEVLSFDDGLLTVRMSGHGRADGWGELAFHERQIEIDADGFHKVEIPPSELRALRDFLNRVVPGRKEPIVACPACCSPSGTPRDNDCRVCGNQREVTERRAADYSAS